MSENPTTPSPMLPATLPGPTGIQEVKLGFDTKEGMDALLRAAKMLSFSTLVPPTYRAMTVDKQGNVTGDNPAGLPNCAVALNMASRMGADPLMVMQNMHVIDGRPSWSSPFIVASINQCGKFSPLRFDLSPAGAEVEVPYTYTEWEDTPGSTKRRPVEKAGTVRIRHQTCVAWATEKATGERLESPTVSMQMAVDEGWVQRKGSKWRTMPEVMLRYRSASFFGRLYAPELLMGLQSAEESIDIQDAVVVHEERPAFPASSNQAPLHSTSWAISSLERFDELLETAYCAFRDAGEEANWPYFERKWREKRGKGDDLGAIRDLAEEVERLVPAAANATE